MENQVEPDKYLFKKSYTNYIFILLFLLYMFDYADRMVLSSLFQYIKNDWHISDAHLGMLGAALKISIVVLTFPASVLIDRWSRTRMIASMAVIWSLATAACAITKNFGQLLTARVIIGVGEAGYAPGGTAMISALYPEKKRSRIMGFWNASIPIGIALGMIAGGKIASTLGWKHAFGIVAIPGIIISILFFLVKDYKTIDLKKENKISKLAEKPMTFKEIVVEFLGKPSLILTYLGFAGVIYVTDSILYWLPTYLTRVEGIPINTAGTKAGIVLLMALIGAPLGGILVDRWRRTRSNARLFFPALTTGASAIVMFISFSILKGQIQYFVLLLLGILVMAFVAGAAAVTQDVVHPGLRAVSYSLAVIIQNAAGATGTIVTGVVSDATNIQTAMTTLPLSLILAASLFFAGSLYYKRDYDSVTKINIVAES
jgi:MFS family permease